MTERIFDGWNMSKWFTDWPEKHIRVSHAAKAIGCNAAHLGQVIKGNRNVSREFLEQVAAYLRMPYDYETGGAAGWFWFPVPEKLKGKGKINDG